MKADVGTQEDIMEFVRIIRKGLEHGLANISLKLQQLELIDMGDRILTLSPELYPWMFRGLVENTMTGQVKEFKTQFQGSIGSTEIDDVRSMVLGIIASVEKAFYP
jgi:hypothetical protein